VWNFSAGIEPAATVAQGHDLQRQVFDGLGLAGIFPGRNENGMRQSLTCSLRAWRVVSEVIGNSGPGVIKRLADNLQRFRTECAASKDFGNPRKSSPRP
jgi:hypothetical protein